MTASKLGGFEALRLLSFYLDRRWPIQPEAHRGMIAAVADMYSHLDDRSRAEAREELGKLLAMPDPHISDICHACRGIRIGMWLSAPIDLCARLAKRISV